MITSSKLLVELQTNFSGWRESIIGKELVVHHKEFGTISFVVTSVIVGYEGSDLIQIKGFKEDGNLTKFYLNVAPNSSYKFQIK